MPSLKEYKTLIKKIETMLKDFLNSSKKGSYEGDAYIFLYDNNLEFKKVVDEEEDYNKEIKKKYWSKRKEEEKKRKEERKEK